MLAAGPRARFHQIGTGGRNRIFSRPLPLRTPRVRTWHLLSGAVKRLVALVAHDGRKHELVELVRSCLEELRLEHLIATEGTGRLIEESFDLQVELVSTGP
jgi:hypothetical protein